MNGYIYWPYFINNQSLTISYEFVKKFSKFIELDMIIGGQKIDDLDLLLSKYTRLRIYDFNPSLNDEIRNKYKDRIISVERENDISQDKYSEKIYTIKCINNPSFADDFNYRELVLKLDKYLDEGYIDKYMSKYFSFPGEYAILKPRNNDCFGLTPDFLIPDDIYKSNKQINNEKIEEEEFITLKQGYSYEGKYRILNCVRVSNHYHKEPFLVMSQELFNIFSRLNLPHYISTRAKLLNKKIGVVTGFIAVFFPDNTLFQGVDLSVNINVALVGKIEKTQIQTYSIVEEQLEKVVRNKYHYYDYRDNMNGIVSKSGITNFRPIIEKDLYTYLGQIILTKKARYILDTCGLGPFSWESIFPASFIPVGDEFKYTHTIVDNKYFPINKNTEDDFYELKLIRLYSSEAKRPEIRTANTIQELEAISGTVFPDAFKKDYKSDEVIIVSTDNGLREFSYLPVRELSTDHDFYHSHPKTYRAYLIAKDGGGDYIALLLHRDSDFKLSEDLYLFDHENGEIEKVHIIK